MSKPVSSVATMRHTDEEKAREFCEAVQKLVKGGAPQFKYIALAVAESPQASADQIAAKLNGAPCFSHSPADH